MSDADDIDDVDVEDGGDEGDSSTIANQGKRKRTKAWTDEVSVTPFFALCSNVSCSLSTSSLTIV